MQISIYIMAQYFTILNSPRLLNFHFHSDDECDADNEAGSGGSGEAGEAGHKDGEDLYMRLELLLGEGAAPPTSTTRPSRAASSHTSFSSLSASSEVNTTASNNTSPVSTLNGEFPSHPSEHDAAKEIILITFVLVIIFCFGETNTVSHIFISLPHCGRFLRGGAADAWRPRCLNGEHELLPVPRSFLLQRLRLPYHHPPQALSHQ